MKLYRLFADTYEGTPHVDMREYAAAGHVVIALKASEGITHVDSQHAVRSREAHAMGLSVIHYHFARPDEANLPGSEAQHFVRVVKPTWRKGDYLWLDYERDVVPISRGNRSWVQEFCSEVHRLLGATPILYGAESDLNGDLADVRIKGERYAPAKYGGVPTVLGPGRWKWSEQYTDGKQGHGPWGADGIGVCDMNELNLRVATAVRWRTGWRRWRALHPRGKQGVSKAVAVPREGNNVRSRPVRVGIPNSNRTVSVLHLGD